MKWSKGVLGAVVLGACGYAVTQTRPYNAWACRGSDACTVATVQWTTGPRYVVVAPGGTGVRWQGVEAFSSRSKDPCDREIDDDPGPNGPFDIDYVYYIWGAPAGSANEGGVLVDITRCRAFRK
jgi:hypothetical protein